MWRFLSLASVGLLVAALLAVPAEAGHGGGGHGGGGHGGGFHGGGFHGGGMHLGGIHPGGMHLGGIHPGFFGGGLSGVSRGAFSGVNRAFVPNGVRIGTLNANIFARNLAGFRRFPNFNRAAFGFRGFFPFGWYGYGLGGYGGYGGYGYGGYGGYGYGPTYAGYYAPGAYDDQAVVPATEEAPPKDDAAHILVIVPSDDAEVWFEGVKTKQTGKEREFVSPVLPEGKNFTYEIRAKWTADGKVVEQKRTVQVFANKWMFVDFTQPNPGEMPKAAPEGAEVPKVPE
jgi:uncharacterized protein (TIGR03000 family)